MSESKDLVVVEPVEGALSVRLPRLDVAAIQARVADIERVIDTLMVKGTHYGPPYPNADKDALLQPGAELILEAFGLVPRPKVAEIDLPGEHKRFVVTGSVESQDGRPVGEMEAECSTLEPKYRYRNAGITCPECGLEGTVLKSKPRKGDPPAPPGGLGWFCWNKKGGCGANFSPGDSRIADQKPGRVDNPDPAELYHTCKAMAQKRWLVGITKRTFALSGRFIDVESVNFAKFNWDKAAPLLRAIPGEKREKWNRVIVHSLQEFGKPPEELTILEGSVVMDWLASQVQHAPDLNPSDFMLSPEGANGAPPKEAKSSASGTPSKKLLREEAKSFENDLRKAKVLDEFAEVHGPPSSWTSETIPEILAAIEKAGAA